MDLRKSHLLLVKQEQTLIAVGRYLEWVLFAKFQMSIFLFLSAYFSTVDRNIGGLSCVKIYFYRGLCSCCEVLGALRLCFSGGAGDAQYLTVWRLRQKLSQMLV